MSDTDARGGQLAAQIDEREAGRRPSDAEIPASPAPAGRQGTASTEAPEEELLCTICGLRACWT